MPLIPDDWKIRIPFLSTPEEVLKKREEGLIYSFNFTSGEGKYILSVINASDPVDATFQISPKIELRLTYIFKEDKIVGLQLSKLDSKGKLDKIHLSTMDWGKVLTLLQIFNNMDAKSIASESLILDKTIVSDPKELEKFLNTVASDPQGKTKLTEVAKNFKLLNPGDIDKYTTRKENAELMDKLLNDSEFFQQYKQEKKIGKDEEVWQQFFKENDWLLGSDIVEVLEERDIDEDNTADLPLKHVDGFLDIIELKLPDAPFWTQDICPNAELTKAIIQCMRYVTEYERRFNDHKKIEELGVDILKPRITLIYGRSDGWEPIMSKQLRILNSSFHNITILTYDHVFLRAQKLSGYKKQL